MIGPVRTTMPGDRRALPEHAGVRCAGEPALPTSRVSRRGVLRAEWYPDPDVDGAADEHGVRGHRARVAARHQADAAIAIDCGCWCFVAAVLMWATRNGRPR